MEAVHFVNRLSLASMLLTLSTIWVRNVNTRPLRRALLTLCTPTAVDVRPA